MLKSEFETVWYALQCFREDCIPEGDPMYDEQWDAICGSMARIMETVGIKHEELDE